MEPSWSGFFKHFFRHRHVGAIPATWRHGRPPCHARALWTRRNAKEVESQWQPRSDIMPYDMAEEYAKYPMVTAEHLRSYKERPRRVKMLMRDFIDDSLYNPNYGYFPQHAVIFSPGQPFDFTALKNEHAFHRLLAERYREFEDALEVKSPNPSRQLWHTPTELFRPYYGEAIARYLISNYQISQHYPYHDLCVYEMGAGNGTLMLNILDYIRDVEPRIYERTRFRIIEISASLASLQTRQLMRDADNRGHASKVEIINRSIFDWTTEVMAPCFFLAMEVFDNLAHDAIRYDPRSEEPHQGAVLIDAKGDFYEFYSPDLDPVAARFLRIRHAATGGVYEHPLSSNRLVKYLRGCIPITPNLSAPEFIPTRLMQFFDVLAKYFPLHRLITSDFHYLPQAIKGVNAPVVQTRYQRQTVPVTKLLVHQGYFDMLFPTNFTLTSQLYTAMTSRFAAVSTHEDFLRRWAYLDDTTTLSGENPLLGWYKNASVLVTV